tara:strand:+ start:158 stop:385 length:228 start_codon:yes stop_codon:yes gene_type:complete
MELPKFLLADNAQHDTHLFVVHTEYPRFVLNIATDEMHWMEEFSKDDEITLNENTSTLIEEALAFYDAEIDSLEE